MASRFGLDSSLVKTEPDDGSHKSDKQTLLAVIQFLKKHNFKETEALLKLESGVSEDDLQKNEDKKTEVSQALAAVYKSDDDPSLYEDLYRDLKTFIDSCLDVHKILHNLLKEFEEGVDLEKHCAEPSIEKKQWQD